MRPCRPATGFTLIEVVITLAVMVVAVSAVAATMLSSSRTIAETRNIDVLKTAVRNLVEQLRDEEFSTLATRYGSANGLPFWYTTQGSTVFAEPEDAVASGLIRVFSDETSIPDSFQGLSGGFDLNGDGDLGPGPSVGYVMLPIRLSFVVPMPSGEQVYEFDLILSEDGIL